MCFYPLNYFFELKQYFALNSQMQNDPHHQLSRLDVKVTLFCKIKMTDLYQY